MADLAIRDHDEASGPHVLDFASVPVPLEGRFSYGVELSPEGLVCDVFTSTDDLPAVHAGAIKGRLYLHYAARHGSPIASVRSPPIDIWTPQDGSSARITLMLQRAPGERESESARASSCCTPSSAPARRCATRASSSRYPSTLESVQTVFAKRIRFFENDFRRAGIVFHERIHFSPADSISRFRVL